MNKVKKFLLSKGMYVVAIGCVAVICLSGLYIARKFGGEGTNMSETQAPVSSTKEAQDVVAVPTRKNETPQATMAATGANAIPSTTPSSTNPSANTPSSTPTPTQGNTATLVLQKPVEGETLTDYAMDRLVYNKTLDEWRTHSGVDIGAAIGTDVKAAADGKVVDAKKDPRLGYLIILEHTGGYKTIYANLKEEANVTIGDTVACGDVIGWVGATAPFEYAEDAHLHFEVLLNDVCTNPWNAMS